MPRFHIIGALKSKPLYIYIYIERESAFSLRAPDPPYEVRFAHLLLQPHRRAVDLRKTVDYTLGDEVRMCPLAFILTLTLHLDNLCVIANACIYYVLCIYDALRIMHI